MKELLEKLSAPMPVKWRLQSYTKKGDKAICVPYIDARAVEQRLDDCCIWQDDYFQVQDKVYCKIGIWFQDQWIWRSDTGEETAVSKDKGQASDAFKRAGVKWGIGRFIYTDLPVYVAKAKVIGKKEDKNICEIIDHKGNKVWDITKYINNILDSEMPDKTKPNYDSLRDDYKVLWLEFVDRTGKSHENISPDKLKDEDLSRGIDWINGELEKLNRL